MKKILERLINFYILNYYFYYYYYIFFIEFEEEIEFFTLLTKKTLKKDKSLV